MLLYIQFKTIYNIRFTFNSLPVFQFILFKLEATLERITIDYQQTESQNAVISTPDIGYSFSINPPWTWKNSSHHFGIFNS